MSSTSAAGSAVRKKDGHNMDVTFPETFWTKMAMVSDEFSHTTLMVLRGSASLRLMRRASLLVGRRLVGLDNQRHVE